MIRSVKITNKYANPMKLYTTHLYIEEFSKIVLEIVKDIFINGYTNQNGSKFNADKRKYNLESNLDNDFLKKFDYDIFTMRTLQACGTQASSIIRSCTQKNKQRRFVLRELMKEGTNASKLQSIFDSVEISIPDFEIIQPQIDSRFFDIEESDGLFDGFIQLRLFKYLDPIRIPFNKHKKMLQFEAEGTIQKSIRISKDYISLSYKLPDKEKKKEGRTVGADQGMKTVLSLSDRQQTCADQHGHDLDSIVNTMNRRVYGSKGFKRSQTHRENYINWSINQLDFSEISKVNLERLYQVRTSTKTGRYLSRFTYTLINKKVESVSETEGFAVSEISNAFRSQRCNCCGWTQKSNRKGKLFVCKHCGYADDADINASKNLEEDSLPAVPKWVRVEKLNRKGFFWNPKGLTDSLGEFIVSQVQKMEEIVV